MKRGHGEKKDTDTNAAEHGKKNMLPQFLLDYEPEDIYNADETILYYRAIPDGTLTFKKETISGLKKSKNLATASVTSNLVDPTKDDYC